MVGRLLSFWDGLFSGFSPETSKKNMVYNVHGPYINIYIYIYMCIYICIYIYVYIYIRIHILHSLILLIVFFSTKKQLLYSDLYTMIKRPLPRFFVSVVSPPRNGRRVAWGVYQAFLLARVPRRSGYPRRWPGVILGVWEVSKMTENPGTLNHKNVF